MCVLFFFQWNMYTEYIDFMLTLLDKVDVMIQCDVYSMDIYIQGTHDIY